MISNNTQGNKYHDENGKFTSGDNGSGNIEKKLGGMGFGNVDNNFFNKDKSPNYTDQGWKQTHQNNGLKPLGEINFKEENNKMSNRREWPSFVHTNEKGERFIPVGNTLQQFDPKAIITNVKNEEDGSITYDLDPDGTGKYKYRYRYDGESNRMVGDYNNDDSKLNKNGSGVNHDSWGKFKDKFGDMGFGPGLTDKGFEDKNQKGLGLKDSGFEDKSVRFSNIKPL